MSCPTRELVGRRQISIFVSDGPGWLLMEVGRVPTSQPSPSHQPDNERRLLWRCVILRFERASHRDPFVSIAALSDGRLLKSGGGDGRKIGVGTKYIIRVGSPISSQEWPGRCYLFSPLALSNSPNYRPTCLPGGGGSKHRLTLGAY